MIMTVQQPVRTRTTPLTEYTRYKVFTQRQIDQIKALEVLPEEQRFEMQVVAQILPFRVNEYVINELIDWDNVPADPVFQLTFPQRVMVAPEEFEQRANILKNGWDGTM